MQTELLYPPVVFSHSSQVGLLISFLEIGFKGTKYLLLEQIIL